MLAVRLQLAAGTGSLHGKRPTDRVAELSSEIPDREEIASIWRARRDPLRFSSDYVGRMDRGDASAVMRPNSLTLSSITMMFHRALKTFRAHVQAQYSTVLARVRTIRGNSTHPR